MVWLSYFSKTHTVLSTDDIKSIFTFTNNSSFYGQWVISKCFISCANERSGVRKSVLFSRFVPQHRNMIRDEKTCFYTRVFLLSEDLIS